MKKFQTTDPIQTELVKYSEDELQKKIVEPLFRAMGFEDVRDRSGSNERGKDLTAIKRDAFSPTYFAIQLKKQKLSGKVANKESLAALIVQLHQAIKESIHFPTVSEKVKPNRLVFITPYPMENAAMCSLEDSLSDLKAQGVEIVDGIRLADLVRQYLPEFLTSEQSYRSYSFQRSEVLREANIALQTSHPITMEKLYVEVSLLDKYSIISKLANASVSIIKTELLCGLSDNNLNILQLLSESKFSFDIHVLELEEVNNRYKKAMKEKLVWPSYENGFYEHSQYVHIEPQKIMSRVMSSSRQFVDIFFPSGNTSYEHLKEEALDSLFSVNEFIQISKRLPFFKNIWNDIADINGSAPIKLDAESLLLAKKPICIVGAAGAGKTTFLKHLTQKAALNKLTGKPIFVPILDIKAYSLDGILNFIEEELLKGGFVSLSEQRKGYNTVNEVLNHNDFRVHFDGLDEAGRNVPDALLAIKKFNQKYESIPIVMTSRHTINLKWDSLLVLSLEPFDKHKLSKFVSNWFNSEPSSYQELSSWIENHKNLQSVIQTPLMAALLCVLFSVDVELPETENELYTRRLELLLGQWDSAKGIVKMPKRRRDAYKMFLMNLAYTMQKEETRYIEYDRAVSISIKIGEELRNSKQTVVIDCISRGLLLRDEQGDVSFGHLTYQEHLAAMYLVKHNPVVDIIKMVNLPWWSKTLDFYAMQMSALDQIVKQANKLKRLDGATMDKIKSLIKLAPFTEEKLLEDLPGRNR